MFSRISVPFTLLFAFVFQQIASAATLSFNMTTAYTGSTPGGTPPYMTALFDDFGGTGSVKLTLTNASLLASEFVMNWYFNLDPALNPASLLFSVPTKTGGNGFDDPGISLIADGHTAPGDGKYDIEFSFATSNQGGGIRRFGAGEQMEITISGIPTLTANSFGFLSAPGGGNGPFPTAAHVQGIGPNGSLSGHVTVPEPSSLVLGAFALAVLLCNWRLR